MTEPGKTPPPLRFEFNKAVEEALREHPHLADKIVFIDVRDEKKKYGAEKAIEESELRQMGRRMRENIQLVHQARSSMSFSRDTYGIGALLFYSGDQALEIFSKSNPDAAAFATFDHELGHLLTKGGFAAGKDMPLREVAADSYAIIRNIQRFGKDKATGDHAGFKRAFNFVMHDNPFYLTTFAIDAIMADRNRVDFSKLTPQETLDTADEYAKKHCLSEAEHMKLHKYFFPVRGMLAAYGDMDGALKQMTTLILREQAPPAAFYLGKRIIDGLTAEGQLAGLEWDAIRQKIEAKAKKAPAATKLPPPKAA